MRNLTDQIIWWTGLAAIGLATVYLGRVTGYPWLFGVLYGMILFRLVCWKYPEQ